MTESLRSLRLIALVICLCGTAGAVTNLPTPADSLANDEPSATFGVGTSWMIGMTLVEEGDLAGALPYLSQAWRLGDDVLEVGTVLRDVLMEMGYVRDALDVSTTILEADRDDRHALERHALILGALEQYDRSLRILSDLGADHPDSTRLRRIEGEILVRARRWDEADARYREILATNPDDADRITATLAEIASVCGDHVSARELWQSGLAASPESRPLRSGWIEYAVSRGLDRDAMAAAREGDALEREDPTSSPGLEWTVLVASMITNAGRMDTAVVLLDEVRHDAALGIEGTLHLVRLLTRQDRVALAISILRESVAAWPHDPRPRVYLGEHLAEAGDFAAAERIVRAAVETTPDDAPSRVALVSILARRHVIAFDAERDAQGDSAHAVIMAAAADVDDLGLELPPQTHMMLGATYQALGAPALSIDHLEAAAVDQHFARDALLSLSLAYENLDRDDDLLDVLERLHLSHPDDPVVMNALGYTLADLEIDLERAEPLVRAALEAEPENPAYLDSLGWVLFRQGRFLDAFDLLVRAANALPEDPVILEHLARVLVELDQQTRAVGVARRALAAGGDPEDLADLLDGADR